MNAKRLFPTHGKTWRLAAAILLSAPVFAQDPPKLPPSPADSLNISIDTTAKRDSVRPRVYIADKNTYDFHQFRHETGQFLTAPLRWGTREWLTLAAVGAATYGITLIDQDIRNAAAPYRQYAESPPVFVGDQWGGFFVVPITTVVLITHGWVKNNHTTKKLGYEIGEAALYSEFISFIGKGAVGRARPFTEKGPEYYRPFTFWSVPVNSFPAGHVDAAFALSTVLAKNVKSPVVKVLCYVPALFTAASRILTDTHWAGDVFIGAALGTTMGNWVVNQHRRNESAVQVTSVYPATITIAIR